MRHNETSAVQRNRETLYQAKRSIRIWRLFLRAGKEYDPAAFELPAKCEAGEEAVLILDALSD